MRRYTFAPLDKVVTMKGKVLTEHRNLPTEEQDEAMSDYVDSMLLTNYPRDDGEFYLTLTILTIGTLHISFPKTRLLSCYIESIK